MLHGSIRSGVVFPSVSLPAGCSWLCCKNFSPSFSGVLLGVGGRCFVGFGGFLVFFFFLGGWGGAVCPLPLVCTTVVEVFSYYFAVSLVPLISHMLSPLNGSD